MIIGWGFNLFIGESDLMVYVEIVVLCDVVRVLGNYWLFGCELFVMFEFCVMCVGVIMYVWISCVIYGVCDLKIGVYGSVVDLFGVEWLNYYVMVDGGVLVDECSMLLFEFFVSCCWKI